MTEKPKVRNEPKSKFSFKNKLSGKILRFRPKPGEILATFQPGVADDSLEPIAAELGLTVIHHGSDMNRGFAVLQTRGSGTSEVEASVLLRERRDVANTIPVLIDEEGLTRYFLPDEFTVQFKKGVSEAEARRILRRYECEILTQQRTPGYFTVNVPAGKGLFAILRKFATIDEVAFVEPSEVGFNDALEYIPNDPDFGELWGIRNTGQTVNGATGTAGADIRATRGWRVTRGNARVIIAVIDTGADLDHPDLLDNFLPRGDEDWNFADPDDDSPDDSGSHGTHVAGTAAAVENNVGIIGVAPQCQIMPLRVNLISGMNQNRADAINYVADQATESPDRRYVINCSWRMSGDHTGVRNAIINAVDNNVVIVFAAGNANRDIDVTPQYPAVYPEVIAVAATDQDDRKASFSNFGGAVDLSAPGNNIWSTVPNGEYDFNSGTSMASPHVAGTAALVWSRNRSLSNYQVRYIIEHSCDNIDSLNSGFVGQLGIGRISVVRALSSWLQPVLHIMN